MIDFSIDIGSVLQVGDKYINYIFFGYDGSLQSQKSASIPDNSIPGSSSSIGLSDIDGGNILINIAIFLDKIYLILPPIEVIE